MLHDNFLKDQPEKNITSSKHKNMYETKSVCSLLQDINSPIDLEKMEKLDYELLLVYQKIKLSEEERKVRKSIFKKVKEVILEIYPDSDVKSFGSFSTDLMIPESDIDIIVNLPNDLTEKDFLNKILSNIKKRLYNSNFVDIKSIFHIKRSKTPVLKFKDQFFGIKVDITVNSLNGLETAEFIKTILEERPYMKVFCILLKQFLFIRNQSDAASGGLNGYSQFLLLLSFFQLHPIIQQRAASPLKNIGVLFMDFFQYYGITFPYKNAKITVRTPGYIKNKTSNLSIEDPVDPSNDVASVCRNSPVIFHIFAHAFRIMAKTFNEAIPANKSLVSLWFRKKEDDLETRRKEIVEKYYKLFKKTGKKSKK